MSILANIQEALGEIRDEERKRAADLVRAFADTQPADRVLPLLKLAQQIDGACDA